MNRKFAKWSQYIYISMIFIFLYLPILVIVIYSFNQAKTGSLWTGVTFEWYERLFNDTDVIFAFKNSLTIAIVSSFISTVIGTIGAVGLYKYSFKGKSIIELLLNITIVIPEIILGIALLSYFSQFQINFGIGTLILSHVTFSIPFVLIVVRARFSGFDSYIEDAAMDLGATRLKVFFTIILPNIVPAVFTGAMIAFILSFDDVIINFFVSGPESTTLPIKVFSMLRFGLSPEINALCTVMLIITFVILITGECIKLVSQKRL
ncbi:ABC transporter permease [Clostridium sp. cel8]|jgi:spermidine/putrescine transport system permease protein|uniref:ABC transporter permease n=1 Tax=unclassified Clostridium TaxID=2614128 RepID=UPI0015F6398A|nr:ABC transporter permease [Clostridium sp. cel8]MBA5851852.1 ABC transporter permease [Clostridium sp. cel8]